MTCKIAYSTLFRLALAVGVLLAFAAPAAAHRIGSPRVTWSASKIEQGIGVVQIGHGRHRKDQLDERFDLGPSAFSLGPLLGRGTDWIHSLNPNGTPISDAQYLLEADSPGLAHRIPFAPKGGVAHLDWTQAYDKRKGDADLRFTINQLRLNIVDDNGTLDPSECPAAARCDTIETIVRYHLRAWQVAGGHEFFNVGGGIFGEGHQHAWLVGAATAVDAGQPFWTDAFFNVDKDFGHERGSHLIVNLGTPIVLSVPLKKVHRGALFAVHMTMDAEAINDRGRESAASAQIQDPPHSGPGLVARGLTARAAQSLKEPPVRQRPAARCPGGPSRRAGSQQLSTPAYTVGEASGIPLVLVKRVGGSRGATSAIIDTRSGSAVSGSDFRRTRTVVRFENGDTSPRLVEIPILEDRAVESPESFTVSLAQPHCGRLGPQRTASVTILDDDGAPPPPPAQFTIGGTVDGLQGPGLVLSNLGAPVPVAANGSFAFPGTASSGQPYEIAVATQPHSPDQNCTVENGKGTVGLANVTDIAVHCATIPIPSGLEPTFGSGGRVSTPVGSGQGDAVVVQPGGGIVTAGWRNVVPGQLATDFALTRHDPSGNLDSSFGSGGIATTDFGGAGDEAHDAALMADGGIIAVGETDAPGIQKQDFAVARYRPDGTLDSSFGTGGIATTDFGGHGHVADAVAVQPDGKVVVGGYAAGASGFHSDFALARYNPDGTLDSSFGAGGKTKTDFGALSDDAVRGLAIQPDGRIVAAGWNGEAIELARYLANGQLDPTFGAGGIAPTGVSTEMGRGVELTPGGEILVVGSVFTVSANRDFELVRFGPTGKLDIGFGNGGAVTTDFGGGDDFAENLAIDSAGRIVVVGHAGSSTIFDMGLVRYNPDGTLDTTFGANGMLVTDFHGRGDSAQDVAFDAAGRIIAGGYTANGSDTEFALLRANP